MQTLIDTKKANEQLQKLREVERLKGIEEDKKIEIYAKEKQAKIDMRKARELERFKEKQAAKQRLIDKQVAYLKQLKDEEDSRISSQIKEAEIKKQLMMQEREEKRRKLKREMDHFSGIYWEKKKKQKKEQIENDKKFQQFWNKFNVTLVILHPFL